MNPARASGILLHPTSLPGPHGCGDFGDDALRFVDWLAHAGQRFWQVLPLSPPGPGYSPYMSASTHAGNPMLISTERLEESGLLDSGATAAAAESASLPASPHRADFEAVEPRRLALLRAAAERFFSDDPRFEAARDAFRSWSARESGWLDDYALFKALDGVHDHRSWTLWPVPLARREPAALAVAAREFADECRFWSFVQWQFDVQWQAVRDHARARGIGIIGDLPIYCASHSADTWVDPQLFEFDADRQPTAVAGVPPDYFSATGQLWGNPLYRWPAHAAEGYRWWIARMRSALRHADIVRIDHFRGFAGYWEVPASAQTAVGGCWRRGPGPALFEALRAELGDLPIIAEDLGTITPDVIVLRDTLGLPGMAVLQFAFGGSADNAYLPHNLERDTVVYTGTHDNDTTLGWFAQAPAEERRAVQIYLKTDGHEINWDLIHAASSSVANLAIYPFQDVLGLGSEGRMNLPSVGGAQWRWRFDWDQVVDWHAERLALIGHAHGRPAPRIAV
ncbi:MAG: 4-alpha-glucanotransferase [Burkholderiaceae bacterium]